MSFGFYTILNAVFATTLQGLRLTHVPVEITLNNQISENVVVRINFLKVVPNEGGKPTATYSQTLLKENGETKSELLKFLPFNIHEKLDLTFQPDLFGTGGSNFGPPKGFNNSMVEHLLKDLDQKTTERLRACRVTPTIMIWGESDTAQAKLEHADNTLVLASGFADGQLEGKAGTNSRNLWVPFASTFFVEAPHLTPLDLIDRTHAIQNLAKKKDDLSVLYMQRDCKSHRETFWDAVCMDMVQKNKTCHYTECNGDKHLGEQYPHGDRESIGPGHPLAWEDTAIEAYKKFKFSVSMENKINNYGYLTEKIVLPLMAGTVPMYKGAKQVTEIFDPEVFVNVEEGGEEQAINKMLQLLEDKDKYERMVSQPAVSEDHFRKYFTWHASTWPKYGDELRMRIIENLLEICNP